MVHILREWVTAAPTEEQEKLLFSSLASRYTPLLSSGSAELSKILKQDPEAASRRPMGELFIPPNGDASRLFYYLKFSSGIEAGSISTSDVQDEHNSFVQSIVSVVGEDAKRRHIPSVNRVFAALSQEWGTFAISQEDREAARLLLDPVAQTLLREVVKGGRAPIGEGEQSPPKHAIEQLERAGMVKSQYSIFCRQTGNQIMMVDSVEAISEATKQGFKCFVCGRSFSEEKLTQFVSPTHYGQRMSRANYWLVVQTCEALSQWFPPEKISVSMENELATIFLNLETSLLLIEIKEKPYKLKDAYLFSRKVAIYKPAASFLLLCTPPVPDIPRFLTGTLENHPFWVGHALGHLQEKLPLLLKEGYKRHLGEVLERFTELSAVSLDDFALTYLFPKDDLAGMRVEREQPSSAEPPLSVHEMEETPRPGPSPPAAKDEILETLPSEILEFETHTVVPKAPSKSALVQKILNEIESGVAGRESSLHILLQDLSDADRRCKACLISQDGLVVASTMQEETSEILASYGSECFTLVENLLKGHDLTPLRATAMASQNFSVELYPLPGFYLVVATTLETAITEALPEASLPETLKLVCDRLLTKKGITSAGLITQDGLLLCEAGADSGQSSPLFPLFLELFPKLSSYFGPIGQGNLQSIAVRTPSHNIALTQSGRGYIGLTFDAAELYEDFISYVLAIAAQAAHLFAPAEV